MIKRKYDEDADDQEYDERTVDDDENDDDKAYKTCNVDQDGNDDDDDANDEVQVRDELGWRINYLFSTVCSQFVFAQP